MQDIVIFIQHHLVLSLALVIVLLILVALEFIKIKRGAKRLSTQQAIQLINHENATVIDIRNKEAFVNGHIVSAISLPLRDLEESTKKLEKYITQPIIIVCASGLESQRAANLLDKKGYNVRVLDGGLRMWQQAGMPLVKD